MLHAVNTYSSYTNILACTVEANSILTVHFGLTAMEAIQYVLTACNIVSFLPVLVYSV